MKGNKCATRNKERERERDGMESERKIPKNPLLLKGLRIYKLSDPFRCIQICALAKSKGGNTSHQLIMLHTLPRPR